MAGGAGNESSRAHQHLTLALVHRRVLVASFDYLTDTISQTTARIQTLDFANGIRLSDDQTLQCNLHVEIHGLRRLLRTLGETWGLCVPMEATLKSIYEAITQ